MQIIFEMLYFNSAWALLQGVSFNSFACEVVIASLEMVPIDLKGADDHFVFLQVKGLHEQKKNNKKQTRLYYFIYHDELY